MFSKKTTAAAALYRARVADLLARRKGGLLLVFNYHRIRPDERYVTDFDDGAYDGPTVEEFDVQVRWLSSRLKVLSESDLLAILRTDGRLSEPAAMITFDDGYRDNFTLARPVLARHGVPAIFFVPSGLIESRELGWWDQIAYLVKRTDRPELSLDGRRFDLADKDAAIYALHMMMKRAPAQETHDAVERIARALDVEPPDRVAQSAELMTWDELRQCPASGIAVGSHGQTHRVLSTLGTEEQRAEVHDSKRLIEQRIGARVRSLAYPVGGRDHFSDTTKTLVAEAGYSLAFSFSGPSCVNRWETIDRFDVRRMPPASTVAMTAAMAALPNVFLPRPQPWPLQPSTTPTEA